MKTYGRLVQDVEHAHQARANLGRQADALGLSARERTGRTVEGEIIEPNVHEDLNPEMLEGLKLHFVKTIQEVVEQGLQKDPVPVEPGKPARDVALTPAAAGTPN